MLGRNDHTREELAHAKDTVDGQLKAYKTLVEAVANGSKQQEVAAALEDFEALFFNNMTLVLDRLFVHRLRMVAGRQPAERSRAAQRLVDEQRRVLRGNTVIRLVPCLALSILKTDNGCVAFESTRVVVRQMSSRWAGRSASHPSL
jgi:hypothetical protein